MFLAAVVQLNCTSDEKANWESASGLIERAAGHGARFVATPENTNYLGPHAEKVRRAEPLDGPTCERFAGLARGLGIHLLLGSFNEKSDEASRCYNTSVLFSPEGAILAVYRKIHLYDVNVPGGANFAESATCKPGDAVVVAATPLGPIGMTICYDLRFPELYRKLVDGGAEIITIPSAFTLATGKDHWEPLLRARAIETQCYGPSRSASTGGCRRGGLPHPVYRSRIRRNSRLPRRGRSPARCNSRLPKENSRSIDTDSRPFSSYSRPLSLISRLVAPDCRLSSSDSRLSPRGGSSISRRKSRNPWGKSSIARGTRLPPRNSRLPRAVSRPTFRGSLPPH
jgi:predicted amidohydrolase